MCFGLTNSEIYRDICGSIFLFSFLSVVGFLTNHSKLIGEDNIGLIYNNLKQSVKAKEMLTA